MVDLAYDFTLNKRGYRVWYTPCAEVVHYGSRSIGQNPEASLREETEAFIRFNEAYGYFQQDWFSRQVVRAALRARLFLRLLEQQIIGDRVICKGPVTAYARRMPATHSTRTRELPEHAPRGYEPSADLQ